LLYQENWEEPLKYLKVNKRVLRGAKPLFFNFLPLPLKGKGDTGGWGYWKKLANGAKIVPN